jgi:hypothetical protein
VHRTSFRGQLDHVAQQGSRACLWPLYPNHQTKGVAKPAWPAPLEALSAAIQTLGRQQAIKRPGHCTYARRIWSYQRRRTALHRPSYTCRFSYRQPKPWAHAGLSFFVQQACILSSYSQVTLLILCMHRKCLLGKGLMQVQQVRDYKTVASMLDM